MGRPLTVGSVLLLTLVFRLCFEVDYSQNILKIKVFLEMQIEDSKKNLMQLKNFFFKPLFFGLFFPCRLV